MSEAEAILIGGPANGQPGLMVTSTEEGWQRELVLGDPFEPQLLYGQAGIGAQGPMYYI